MRLHGVQTQAKTVGDLFVAIALREQLVHLAFPVRERLEAVRFLPRILQAVARIDTGEWFIDDQARPGVRLGPDTARGPDGHVYPNKPPGSKDAAAWVLSDFPKEPAMISAGCEGVEAIVGKGITAAMNQHNGRAAVL